jgi:hypothetical protein
MLSTFSLRSQGTDLIRPSPNFLHPPPPHIWITIYVNLAIHSTLASIALSRKSRFQQVHVCVISHVCTVIHKLHAIHKIHAFTGHWLDLSLYTYFKWLQTTPHPQYKHKIHASNGAIKFMKGINWFEKQIN